LAARFTEGLRPPFGIYAAFQVWAQAVEKAGTFETQAVAAALRGHPFDTVLGRIGFDQKGDASPAMRPSSGMSGRTASTCWSNPASSPSETEAGPSS
jgi:hypothetical protein